MFGLTSLATSAWNSLGLSGLGGGSGKIITPATAPTTTASAFGITPSFPQPTGMHLSVDEVLQQIWPQPWYSPGDLDPIAGDSPEVRSVYFGLYKKEPRLNAAIEGKVASIATQEITITAADEDRPQDVEAAQFIDSAIKTSNQSWVTLIVSLLRPGCIFGWAVNEIKMRPIRHGRFQNKWGLEHIRSLNTEPFLKVQLDTFRNIYGLVNLVRGIQDYKPEKFVWYANKPLFGNPFGQSDVQPAERAVRLFREAYQVWYVALKRYSLPYMHGKVDDPNQRAMLEAALKDIQGTGWAVTGKEDEITVLNMAAAAAISGFEAMIDKVSEDIFFAVRGSSTPSQPSSNKGGDVRHDTETSKKTGSDPIEQLIAEEVCLSINRWLIPRLMEPNFPPDVGMPIATLANVDMEWVKDRLDVLKAVEDSGRKVSSKLWFKTANAKPADPNDPLDAQALAASQGPQGGPGAGGAGQPGVPESPPPGGPAGASGGPGASPGGPDDSGSPAPKLPGGGGATPNVAPAGGGSSETQSPPATAAAPSSDDNAGNDDDAPTVPPELIAAMLQAKIDGDHQAVDRLAEMGADPEELAEFMADREGGTQGMVGTQAFAGLVKRFSMFAADARSDTPKVAGLAVRAADTGRLLMLQRADSPDDPAAGKWEFPGGHIKVGESPEKAAFREWCEETGHVFDAGRGVQKPQDRWTAPNGYTLFFTEVPDESKIIEANPREQSESLAWIDPDDLDHPDVREELRNELPQISRLLRGQQPLKTFGWFSDPSPKSKSRATNSDTGAHAYGEQARRLLAHQGREDRGEPHPKTTKQVLQEHKASMEPKREEARKAYRFAIADPTSVRPKQLKALAEHLHALTRDEVRQNLRELEHKTFGKLKHELVDALLKHVESRSAENAEALKKMKDAAAADDGFGFGMDEMFGGPRAGDAGVKMRDKKTHEDRMKERNIVAREHGPGRVDTGSVRHIGPIPHQEAVPHNPSERESVQPIDRPDELPDAIGRPATKPIPMPAAAHVTKPPKGESPTPEERDEAMRAAADIKPPAQPPDDIDREQDAAAVAHRDRMEDWQRDKPDSLAAEEAAGRAQGRVDAARSQEPAAVSPEKPSPPGGKPLNVPKDPRRLTIDQADQALEALGYTEVRRVGGDTGSPDDHGVVVARGPDGQEHEMRPADVKRAIYGEGVMPTAAKLNSQDLSNLFTQTGRGKLLGAAKMENGKVVSWKVKSPDGGADLVLSDDEVRQAVIDSGLARGAKTKTFAADSQGHEHKGKGPGGGQFVSKGEGGDSGGKNKDSTKNPAKEANNKNGGGSEPPSKEAETQEKMAAQAREIVKKIKPTKQRATDAPQTTRLDSRLAGAIGEEVIIQHLKSLGYDDAGQTSDFLKTTRNNLAFDLIHDHQLIEAKAGQADNPTGVWALKYDGRYTKEQEAAFAKMGPEEAKAAKKAINADKVDRIHKRKDAFIKDMNKKLGFKVAAGMMTVIINPDTKTVDLFQFDGIHDRIPFGSEMAKAGYVKSVKYG